ncbi:DUF4241 domain-containing protein [Kibdelosporangium lantanae]|uniref:DUF4241 domain-containing protein n=1 Tax=Kibdelosporangium lantanae TaxID=1497396 RepID=A0ABW3M8R5_9PSEU
MAAIAVLVLAGLVVVNRFHFGRGMSASTDTSQQPPEAENRKLRKDGFDKLFEPGRVNVGHNPYDLTVHDTGLLDLPSGKLLAGDPYLLADDRPNELSPFVVTVPPGRYPVSVSMVLESTTPTRTPMTPGARLDKRIAAARMVVKPEPVVRWQMAFIATDDPAKLKDNEFYGYGVDAGMGAFTDVTSVDAIKRVGEENGLLDKVDTDEAAAWNVRDPISDRNVVAFHSGFGDGAYPTWIGYTAANEPAVFVTDFLVVDVP